ncbi:MAG: TolC family protein [Bacteroidetes bacterium]|nr:TolC family protein [Bacteroidota bacterium]
MSLEDAEKMFLQNNLMLLAKQYNISAKQALIIQSKSYPNPTFNADINVIDPQNHKYFHIDSSGQKSFQVQQLILLGGKRKTEIDLAKQNKILAESEFSELLRNLKFQLTQAYYTINSERTIIQNYDKQLQILDTIISAYKIQSDKGNIPLKDIIRLKSVYIKLDGNRAELAADYSEQQKQLKLLIQINQEVIPVVSDDSYKNYVDLKPLNDLQTLALANRPDLKIADESAIISALILKREKKQAIPDIAVNTSYDQRGGAFRNQVNAGVTLPIPILNTNRGNIKAAEFDKKEMDLYVTGKKLEVELDIQHAWINMQRNIKEYNKVILLFNEEFSQVNKGVNDNFQQRNISILEFVDFVESYNESLADFERIKKQLALSAAKINYVTATKIY